MFVFFETVNAPCFKFRPLYFGKLFVDFFHVFIFVPERGNVKDKHE